jgi:retinoid hydroxylase
MSRPSPPGSLGPPFLGETLQFLADPAGFTLSRTRRHGALWKTRILGDTVVFFAGPEAYSFFVDPEHFARAGAAPKAHRQLLHPDAVPFLDGERHLVRKRLLLRAFEDDQLDRYLPGLFTILRRFAARWTQQPAQPLADDLSQLGFDVADHLFAASDPSTSNPEGAADFALFLRGTLAPPVNLPFTAFGRALRARDRFRAYLARQLAGAHATTGTVLGALRAARGPEGEHLTADELEIELFHFFFAAHGGLTAALAWSLVTLGEHPELAARIRREADAELGAGLPTLAEVRRLRTARAVAREVLRVYPIAPFTFFGVATRDLELDGYRIRAGWKGAGAIWATLQDESVFADPAAFHGERLLDERFETLPANAYVPQGGGPIEGHRCAGEALVRLLMPAFLGWFTKHYDWSYPPQDAAPAGAGLAPLPRSGVRGAVTPRR